MGWHVFWIAFIASLDSLSVGITYGIRKIRIPILSVVIMSICSAVVIFATMNLGHWLAKWIPSFVATFAGATIFITLGIVIIIQQRLDKDCKRDFENEESIVKSKWDWKQFGSIIQVLQSPTQADMDQSGTISTLEAFFLGTALSLDSLVVGLGASTIKISPSMTAGIVFMLSTVFLYLGMWLGTQFIGKFWRGVFVYIPGVSFILLGLFRLVE